MAFDGIVTKAIASELQELSGARIDKILEPNKNTIILGLYHRGKHYALYICIDAQNGRFHLTTHQKPNPSVAPNFCMVLRKHLLGLRIKNIFTKDLDRVITIELEGFDEIDDILQKKLIIELMGKHGNLILKDENNKIIDCLRHIPNDENSALSRLPNTLYSYPVSTKKSLLDITDLESFKNQLPLKSDTKLEELPSLICKTYDGISQSNIQAYINQFAQNDLSLSEALEKIYQYLQDLLLGIDSMKLAFKPTINAKNKKDYFLLPQKNEESFSLNFFIDDFYEEKESNETFKNYRNSVLKLILNTLQKYQKRLQHINEKLKDCENMEQYQLYGELLTANLYRIPTYNIDKIELENYYKNNEIITIPLDKKYSPSINAKRYFKKYRKLKNALEIVSIQKQETIQEVNYIESIVYELEACTNISDISDIYEEISENVIFQDKVTQLKNNKNKKVNKSKLTKNKFSSFNPIKFKIQDYTLLVGRNNVENDYLTLKYAKKTDLWFHTKDIHGSHAILLLENKPLPDDTIIIQCAKIAAYHSKAKLSSNVPVDFCEVKYVKKPNGAKPGMVIYTNQKTLYVKPSEK